MSFRKPTNALYLEQETVAKETFHRQKVPTAKLLSILNFLDDHVHCLAFGRKLIALDSNPEYVALDSVKRTQKVHALLTEYFLVMDSEGAEAVEGLPPPSERCLHRGKCGRQCMRRKGHSHAVLDVFSQPV